MKFLYKFIFLCIISLYIFPVHASLYDLAKEKLDAGDTSDTPIIILREGIIHEVELGDNCNYFSLLQEIYTERKLKNSSLLYKNITFLCEGINKKSNPQEIINKLNLDDINYYKNDSISLFYIAILLLESDDLEGKDLLESLLTFPNERQTLKELDPLDPTIKDRVVFDLHGLVHFQLRKHFSGNKDMEKYIYHSIGYIESFEDRNYLYTDLFPELYKSKTDIKQLIKKKDIIETRYLDLIENSRIAYAIMIKDTSDISETEFNSLQKSMIFMMGYYNQGYEKQKEIDELSPLIQKGFSTISQIAQNGNFIPSTDFIISYKSVEKDFGGYAFDVTEKNTPYTSPIFIVIIVLLLSIIFVIVYIKIKSSQRISKRI